MADTTYKDLEEEIVALKQAIANVRPQVRHIPLINPITFERNQASMRRPQGMMPSICEREFGVSYLPFISRRGSPDRFTACLT